MWIRGGQLTLLSEDDMREIHYGTLRILGQVGVRVPEVTVLERLHDTGAYIDRQNQRVRFPPWLVEELVQQAPSSVSLVGRNPANQVQFAGRNVNFVPSGAAVNVLDLDGNRRQATVQDAGNLSRIADALELLCEGSCLVFPGDVPQEAAHAHMMLAMLRNTEKPFRARSFGRDVARDCIHMAEMTVGGREILRERPLIYSLTNSFSPLGHGTEELQSILEYAQAGLPIAFCPEVQAGSSGPVTLAGTLTQLNAEALSGIIIIQAINPGNPVLYGTVSTITDMRIGAIAYGAIEAGMLNVAVAQMARFYGVPSRGTGGFSDSKDLDMQAGIEAALTAILAALGGINLLLGAAGAIESSLTASYEKLVLDHETLGMIARLLRGIEVDEESLALGVIAMVGPGGHYLSQKHTKALYKSEHYMPSLSSREAYEAWKQNGKLQMRDRARERCREILASHQPAPLDPALERELVNYVKHVEERVAH